jgi:hypothetical protein
MHTNHHLFRCGGLAVTNLLLVGESFCWLANPFVGWASLLWSGESFVRQVNLFVGQANLFVGQANLFVGQANLFVGQATNKGISGIYFPAIETGIAPAAVSLTSNTYRKRQFPSIQISPAKWNILNTRFLLPIHFTMNLLRRF